jgi:hypothetical protein
MRREPGRTQLVLIAAALLVFVVVQVALAGPSGPTAQSSGGLKSKVKSLTKQVATLTGQVSALTGQVAALQSKGTPTSPTSLPPSGPASGDLTGSYPAPALSPPPAATLVGLPDSISLTCTSLSPGWYDFNPALLNPLGYYRDRQGRVFLQGTIQQCGSPGSTVTNLPAGFRPPKDENFPIVGPTAPALGAVGASGDLVIQGGATTNRFGLDGVNFRCGPSGANGCP